jgi:hypothetical protein
MNEPLTLEILKEKLPVLREWLKKRHWYPMSYMIIPSVLKTADEYISFLENITTDEAKLIREELIFLRMDFRREPCPPPKKKSN